MIFELEKLIDYDYDDDDDYDKEEDDEDWSKGGGW